MNYARTFTLTQGKAQMCVKLDLSKAFDSLNRHFIGDVLLNLGFDSEWINWMHECWWNPSFELLINGERSQHFSSTSGIRQGDPLSPYIFLLAMQVLSSILKKAEQIGEIDPLVWGLYLFPT